MRSDMTKSFTMETEIVCHVERLENWLKKNKGNSVSLSFQSKGKNKKMTAKFLKSFAAEVDKCRT